MKQPDNLAEWVRKGRIKAKMTQKELSEYLDITTVHLSKIENGHSATSIGNISAMTRLFGKNFVI